LKNWNTRINMTKAILTGLISGLILLSCESKPSAEQSSHDYVSEAKKLNLLLNQGNVPPQRFEVGTTGTSEITGAKGINLRVDPNDLETESGKPLGNKIQIELRELTQPYEYIFSDVTGTSFGGKQILFGGTYWIAMTSDGQKLRIRPGRALKINFRRFSSKRQEMFTGNRDSVQNVAWVNANQRFKRISWEGSLEDHEYYQTMPVNRLGWITSGVTNRASQQTSTRLTYTISDPGAYAFGKAHLIIEKEGTIQALTQTLFFNSRDNFTFEQVPLNGSGLFVVTAIKDGKLFAHVSRLNLEINEVPTVSLKQTSPGELYQKILKLK